MSDDPEDARARQRGYERAYRERRRDEINARNRGDSVRPERREDKRNYARQYRAANPEKLREQRRKYDESHRDEAREYYLANRDEISEKRRLRRLENLEAFRKRDREYGRRRKIKKKPWVPPEDWAAMWESQDGRCYLCGEELIPDKAHADHDHSCCGLGRRSCRICRRGLACGPCNMAIGLANDDPERLRRMADALEAAQMAVRQRKTASAGEQLQFPA